MGNRRNSHVHMRCAIFFIEVNGTPQHFHSWMLPLPIFQPLPIDLFYLLFHGPFTLWIFSLVICLSNRISVTILHDQLINQIALSFILSMPFGVAAVYFSIRPFLFCVILVNRRLQQSIQIFINRLSLQLVHQHHIISAQLSCDVIGKTQSHIVKICGSAHAVTGCYFFHFRHLLKTVFLPI